jgi:2-polyprenyl-3-methyl-5-hydroxy-6-metoxy-1,4-benzoquinol methylase
MASDSATASSEAVPEPAEPPAFDTSVAHVARVYNYWLGGTDNFPADRAAAEQAMAAFPDIVLSARANRAFLRRAVTHLAREAGIRQFLDIGTGIPSANNTHEVAQSVASDSRIVYVDNDPVVLAHARALLSTTPDGATDYIDADLRQADQILATAAQTLDFSKPIAVLLMAILQHLSEADEPYQVVAALMAAVPPGSYLVLSHPAKDIHAAEMAAMAAQLNKMMAEKVTFRAKADVAPFFAGLELVEPGMTNVPEWRPETEEEAASPAALWAGVARKP